jgi:hypothetical protein
MILRVLSDHDQLAIIISKHSTLITYIKGRMKLPFNPDGQLIMSSN